MKTARDPIGIKLIACFFLFGSVMSGLATLMLLLQGTWLEALWRLNPRARAGLTAMGHWGVLLMVSVCAACVLAATGLWKRTRWGFRIAVAILVLNALGDSATAFLEHDWRTLIGLPVAGVMIAYLIAHAQLFANGPRPG